MPPKKEQPVTAEEEVSDMASLIEMLRVKEESRSREDAERRKQDAYFRQQELDSRRHDEEQRRQIDADRRREDAERYQKESAMRQQEFQEFLKALKEKIDISTNPSDPSKSKPVISKPSALQPDATYQGFTDWKQNWDDYANMTDLENLPLAKRHIQLRSCLSSDIVHTLRYRLGVSQDDTTKIADVLQSLEKYFKAKTNEALRRRDLFSCRQEAGEQFNDFYVRVKKLSEAVDVCKQGDTLCEETQIKNVILMGVEDQELVQELIALIPTKSLDDVVRHCFNFEAARQTASVITSKPSNVCAVSKYKKDKKANQRSQKASTPNQDSCKSCGHSHEQNKCPAAEATCGSCGRKGHRPRTERCPARDVKCRKCNKKGHYDKCCHSQPGESQQQDSSSQQKGNSVCRVNSTTRSKPKSAPPVSVTVTHSTGKGVLLMLPDTGADTTIIGPDHLPGIGLKKEDLRAPPQTPTYGPDGNLMNSAIGSVEVQLEIKGNITQEWIDVHPGTPTPLLSYQACQKLALIPEKFPRPIAQVTHARVQGTNKDEEILENPPFSSATTPTQAKEYFLKEFSDVLVRKQDMQGTTLKTMKGPPMRIHLRQDAQPFAIHTPRQVPLAYKEQVKKELENMVTQGIITPAGDHPSPWCHPLVAVPKPNGGVRITTDLSKLNSQVSRPAHPSPTPFAAIRSIPPGSKFFTTVDALHGYWQLELAEEDQDLTTFITPYGRYKYLRGPMGFAATGDAFCRRGDEALSGLQNCVKVVDDILLYDEDLMSHLHKVHNILTRCRATGITLNADKFTLATPAVKFCGFIVSADGIAPDPEKVSAIQDFATPANITDLRSFMGLVNQLTEFSPEISAAAQPLRPLMSPRRAFIWTADHDAAFQHVKKAMASPPILAVFDPQLPTILQTDASRLYGIGYALLQDHHGHLRLVQCGSRFLSDTETCYATIELEMLATVWAMHKCGYYLKGLHHFEHITDHRPLIPILNHYTLDAVENPRLQRLKEKLSPFTFTAKWRAGKQLCIPDALSRHPVSCPTDEDDMLNDVSVRDYVAVRAVHTLVDPEIQSSNADVHLEEIQQAARTDETYLRLLECVRHGFPSNRYNLDATLLDYWKIRDELYCDGDLILYGPRIVIPASLRKSVLKRLHDSHRGTEATKRRARQTVFWPGINSDIINIVRACDACQTLLPSQQQEEYRNDDQPTRPFESVSADFFSVAGKSFLVIVDRMSWWPVIYPCGNNTTAASTIQQVRQFFVDKGIPVRLRTDGGPQFTSKEFQDFLKRWNVKHMITSPHHPQSNGHAEAAVKALKHLIQKVAPNGNIRCEDFDRGLLEMRNMPNKTGRSPAQILYGHPLRTCVPAHPEAFKPEWQPDTEECDRRAAQLNEESQARYNKRARPLPVLSIDQSVRIQDPVSKKWNRTGKVVARPRPRQYDVCLSNGRTLKRNRIHLHAALKETLLKAQGIPHDYTNIRKLPRLQLNTSL